MGAGRVALIVGLLLAGVAPAQAWMTFVARDVATGERLGLGARVVNENEGPALAIVCTSTGLTATFDTGIAVTADTRLAEMGMPLSVGADGGAYDPFPNSAETFDDGDGLAIRLRLSSQDAMGLAEYVLNATSSIQVSYRVGADELVYASFANDSAPISIGAVLGECEGRGKSKTKD